MFTALDFIKSAKVFGQSPPLDETSPATLLQESDRAQPIANWVLYLDTAITFHMNTVIASAADFFTDTEEIRFVSGTQEYLMPGNTVRVIGVERESGELKGLIDPINIKDRCSETLFDHYYIWGQNLGFTPADPGIEKSFNMLYIRQLVRANYGTVQAGSSATNVVLPASPIFGYTSPRDGYYRGSRMYLVSGPGAGEISEISDYDGTSRACTVAFTTTPTADTVYDILCDIPGRFQHLIWMHMALQAKGVDGDPMKGVASLYSPFQKQLETDLRPRQAQKPRFIHYTPTLGYDGCHGSDFPEGYLP